TRLAAPLAQLIETTNDPGSRLGILAETFSGTGSASNALQDAHATPPCHAKGVKATVARADRLRMVPPPLAQANDVLFKAFHLSSDAIAVTRVDDGRIVDANEAFLRLVGFERDEVIGRTTL